MADPRSAPSMMARPAARPMAPDDMKPARSMATAVELCMRIAATAPVAAAETRFVVDRRSQRRSCRPNALSKPVRTRRTAQIRSAAAAAMFSRIMTGELSIRSP